MFDRQKHCWVVVMLRKGGSRSMVKVSESRGGYFVSLLKAMVSTPTASDWVHAFHFLFFFFRLGGNFESLAWIFLADLETSFLVSRCFQLHMAWIMNFHHQTQWCHEGPEGLPDWTKSAIAGDLSGPTAFTVCPVGVLPRWKIGSMCS